MKMKSGRPRPFQVGQRVEFRATRLQGEVRPAFEGGRLGQFPGSIYVQFDDGLRCFVALKDIRPVLHKERTEISW